MSNERQSPEAGVVLTRRGKVIYETNPSIVGRFPVKVVTGRQAKGQTAYMVAPDSGEVLASGTFGFIEEKELDSEQFVKVYLDGIKQYSQLSRAGALLFELVYREISGLNGKNNDSVTINYIVAQRWKTDLSRRTYERGMNELLEREFLFRSIAADVYFVNVRFMFNGDRMAVVKAYRRKGAPPSQPELPFAPPPARGGADE